MGQPAQGIPAQDMLQGMHALQMGSLSAQSTRLFVYSQL
jgi:hypothetical protein